MIPTQSRMPPKKLQPSKCLAWAEGSGATGFSVVGFEGTAGDDCGVVSRGVSVLFSVSFSVTSSPAGVGLTVVSPSWVSLVAAAWIVVLVTASPTVVVMVVAGLGAVVVGVVSLLAAAVVLELLRAIGDSGPGGAESSWSPPGLRGWLSTVTTKATMKAMRKNAFAIIVP